MIHHNLQPNTYNVILHCTTGFSHKKVKIIEVFLACPFLKVTRQLNEDVLFLQGLIQADMVGRFTPFKSTFKSTPR